MRTCALVLTLLAEVAVARAQVAVLRIDPEAEGVCRDVEGALNGVGLVPDPGYLSEARQQGVEPASDAGLELITPLLQIKLAVVPLLVDDDNIQLEYRDGQNGARLGTASIPHERGKLLPRGRAQLKREVVTHLGTVLSGEATPAAGSRGLSGETATAEPDAAPEGEAHDTPRALRIRIHVGVGVGTRDVDWAADGRSERVQLGAFPAFDLGLSFTFRLSDSIALAPRVDYQSSLAFHEVEMRAWRPPPDIASVCARIVSARARASDLFVDEKARRRSHRRWVCAPQPPAGVAPPLEPGIPLMDPLAQLALGIPISDAVALRIIPERNGLGKRRLARAGREGHRAEPRR